MSPGRTEPIRGRDGEIRAVRVRLEGDPDADTVRTDSAGMGLRIDFDAHGRPLALEIDTDELADLDRIDRLLETLGHPPLKDDERATVTRRR